MKISHRATTTVALSAALLGGLLFAAPTVAQAASPPVTGAMVPASGSPPEVVLTAAAPTALPKYRVVVGDTLWAIGVRYHRSWPALASYNRVPNPNLIYVGDLITIPPTSYVGSVSLPASASTPAPAPSYTPPVTHSVTHYSAPVQRTYTPPAPRPVVSQHQAYGGYQACVAMRESGNGSGSSNIYGFLQSTWSSLGLSGSPGSASRSTQDAAFQTLYARAGTAPWSPYDGC